MSDECFYLFAVITEFIWITFKGLLYYIGWTIVMCLSHFFVLPKVVESS